MRAELAGRVRARRAEIERAICARVLDSAFGASGEGDAEYVAGLRAAVAAALEYALAGIGREREPQVPPEAIAQAQRAARAGVGLGTVLRRYTAGSSLLGDAVVQEAGALRCGEAAVREALSAQAVALERLLARVTSEYEGELERTRSSPAERRAERVLRLLAGGSGDLDDLGYDLGGWHVGAIARGRGAGEALRAAASATGSRLLCVQRGETVWGWLGSSRKPVVGDVARLVGAEGHGDGRAGAGPGDHAELSLAVGEPAHGRGGWRTTHRQAQAALRVALLAPRRLTRYADVALLAAVLGEGGAASALIEIYLTPLGGPQDGGVVLRETLRAYFAAGRNASSAASALGVSRNTVERRLRTAEHRLGGMFRERQAELEVALRLERLRTS